VRCWGWDQGVVAQSTHLQRQAPRGRSSTQQGCGEEQRGQGVRPLRGPAVRQPPKAEALHNSPAVVADRLRVDVCHISQRHGARPWRAHRCVLNRRSAQAGHAGCELLGRFGSGWCLLPASRNPRRSDRSDKQRFKNASHCGRRREASGRWAAVKSGGSHATVPKPGLLVQSEH